MSCASKSTDLFLNLPGGEVCPTRMKKYSRGPLMQNAFRVGLAAAIALAFLMVPRVASAHAVVVQSSPAVNETVQGPDVAVTLKFNSRVDGKRSTLLLSTSDSQSKPLTIEQQSAPDTLTAHATKLGPGKYAIHWQVLATDGHITRGEIPFSVK
jgi:methionine-rich copper-binding protein CopC